MTLSETAKKRLTDLLPADAAGFSVTGFAGTCRGSTPVLCPAQSALDGQETVQYEGLTFFVNKELIDKFHSCSLDCDRSLFGKGLTATWPHREGCACHS
jgi:Fe-S cluster assembly iron-binding protein IscA